MKFLLLTVLMLLSSRLLAEELKGWMGGELRLYPEGPRYTGQRDDRIVPSLLLNPVSSRKVSPTTSFSSSLFGRLSGAEKEQSHFDIREAYIQKIVDDWEVRLGIAKEFWGVAESRHLVNIVNQADLVEDIDEEELFGQPMLNLNKELLGTEVRFFLLPYFRERIYPGRRGRVRPPLPIAQDTPRYESSLHEWHPDFAIRLRRAIGNWDIGLTDFYGTGREPIFLFTPSTPDTLQPYYQIIHQSGLDLQYTLSNALFKLEAINRSGQGGTFFATVVGLEYSLPTLGGIDTSLLLEYLYDGRGVAAPFTPFDDDLYLGARIALNNVNGSEIVAGVTIDRHTLTSIVSIEGSTRISDHLRLELDAKIFSSTKERDHIYFVKDDDFVQLRVLYHF